MLIQMDGDLVKSENAKIKSDRGQREEKLKREKLSREAANPSLCLP